MEADFLKKLDRKRQKILNRFIISIVLSVAVGIIIVLLTGNKPYTFHFFIFGGIICFIILYFSLINTPLKEYKAEFKNTIVKNVLNDIFQDVQFDGSAFFDKEEIRRTYLVPIGNRYNGDDLLAARYKGIQFRQCDLDIKDVRHSGKTTTTVKYFKGKWLQFEYNKKKLDGYIQIREKEYGGARKVYGIFSDMPTVEAVKTESIWFNDNYEIRAQNTHTAFYLLTPQFMELIKNLTEKIEGQINIAFVNGILHIAIDTGFNTFEPPIISAIDSSIIQTIKEQANMIIQIINALKLNED